MNRNGTNTVFRPAYSNSLALGSDVRALLPVASSMVEHRTKTRRDICPHCGEMKTTRAQWCKACHAVRRRIAKAYSRRPGEAAPLQEPKTLPDGERWRNAGSRGGVVRQGKPWVRHDMTAEAVW